MHKNSHNMHLKLFSLCIMHSYGGYMEACAKQGLVFSSCLYGDGEKR